MGKQSELRKGSLIAHTDIKTYERFLYLTINIAIAAYSIKLNLIHNEASYNIVLFPLLFLFIFVPLALKSTGNVHLSRPFISIFSPVVISVFVYATGGIDSPGLIWLAGLPLVYGTLLGHRFLKMGFAVAIGIVIGFAYLKSIDIYVPWSFSNKALTLSRILDTSLFLLFTAFNMSIFVKEERSRILKIKADNEDIEKLVNKFITEINSTLSTVAPVTATKTSIKDLLPLMTANHDLENSVNQLTSVLQQVTHLKALNEEQKLLTFNKVCAKSCIKDTLNNLSNFSSRKSLKINTHFEDKNFDFYTDSDVLKEIVLKNVIHNAIKYSDIGGTIDIKVWDNDSWIYIEVQDFGIGIPTHLQESLYHFSRENIREGTFGEIGTGYGLPLTARYLNKLRGQIQISSSSEDLENNKECKGTKVLLSLPK